METGDADTRRLVPRWASGRGEVLLPLLLFLAVVALWAFRTHNVLNTEPGNSARWGMEDFRDAVYYPVRSMLEGVNPYYTSQYLERFPVRQVFPLYSPAVLLVNLPFAMLPYEAAQVAYFVFSVALIPVLAALVLGIAGYPPRAFHVLWLSALVAAGRPMYSNLTLGQSALPVAIGVLLALHFARTKPGLGGLGLALATLKPTFGVPLVLLMLVRKDYRALGIGIAVGVFAALIPVLILVGGASGIAGFVEGIPDNLSHFGSHPSNALETASWMRIDAAVALVRLAGVPQVAGLGLMIAAACLGIGALAIHLKRRRDPERGAGAFGLTASIICFAILTSVFHQSYDALIVVLPLTLALTARRAPWRRMPGGVRWVLAGLVLALWFNYLTTNVGLRATGLAPWSTGWRFATSINSVTLLIAFVLTVLLAFRGPVTEKAHGARQASSQ